MSNKAKTLSRMYGSVALLATTAVLGVGFSGCASDDEEGACVSTDQYFAEQVWAPVMQKTCIGCHNSTGIANKTKLVLRSPAEAGYLEANRKIVEEVASFEQNGESLLILKPTQSIAHEGGQVIKPGSEDESRIRTLIDKFKNPPECETNDAAYFAGVQLAGPRYTARKAALNLAGRLPTLEEFKQVDEGGWDAVDTLLDQWMTEEAFFDRIREAYNDHFLTDQYLNGDALGLLGGDDEDSYYNPNWFESIDPGDEDTIKFYGAQSYEDLQDTLRARTVQAVAQEPIELIAHIVRNNRPFTEVLTANYFLVNPYSAKAYNVEDVTFDNEADRYEWKEGYLYGPEGEINHAGVLTSPMWLQRHPTTATNRNRHRARMVYLDWLGTDILKTAERPIDPTKITDFNPTMNNPACTVCHVQIDPIAGAFLNYQDTEDDPEFTWYSDMRPPGFGSAELPFDQWGTGLPWLAQQVTNDPRFAISVVYTAFKSVTGQTPLQPPADTEDPDFSNKFKAYLGQYNTLNGIAKEFKESGYNYKVIIKGIIMSPYFRAVNAAQTLNEDQLLKFEAVGMGHFLTPEQMNRKLYNVLNTYWGNGRSYLLNRNEYLLLYGGIDSDDVTKRIDEPNGVMVNIAERMANEMSCFVVPSEFALPQSERRLFTMIEPSFQPADLNGFVIDDAAAAIKEQIRHLHWTLLGEELETNDPEIERTFQLFLQTWQEGNSKIANEEIDSGLGPCGVEYNYLTGEYFGDEEGFYGDNTYTIRAWMSVMTYLLADYSFIYE